jgi:acetyltransferase
VEAAEALGYPVVVKVDGPAHKAARGGVVRDLAGAAEVRAATERLGGRVLVAEQLSGLEAFCGFAREPGYGAVLAIGPGGRLAEARELAAFTLAPVDEASARRVSDAVPLLGEASEEALAGLARIAAAIARLAAEHPEIAAADVNPVLLGPTGAVAVDALLVVGDST